MFAVKQFSSTEPQWVNKNKGMGKEMWYIYKMKYFSARKKGEVMLSTQGNGCQPETTILSKLSHIPNNKHHVFSHLYFLNFTQPCEITYAHI